MTAPVTFRVTTYWKRKRNEPGLTQMASKRLTISQAIDWILAELPDEAWDVKNDDEDGVTLTIDWAKVPNEIRLGGLL
jgi:hypothetical protein